MSNETKRDVFEDTLDAYDDSRPYPHPDYDSPAKLLDRYNAALPDDLPVIPKDVGEWLAWCKERGYSLIVALDSQKRISQDTFALAWVLGVWRVEETGEIVKLEAKD